MRARPFIVRYFIGIRRPRQRILGMEFAGDVEAVGSAVTEFAVGDEVFGVRAFGAYAEYVCVRETAAVAHKPAGMTYDEAAAVCDGVCIALSCLRKADRRDGRTLLVYGASGSVGTAAVQLARHFGDDVTAVCNTNYLELVLSLGADRVIDYTQEDFAKNGEAYDVIFDAVSKRSFTNCKRLVEAARDLHRDGRPPQPWCGFAMRPSGSVTSGRRSGIAKYTKADVLFLKELIEAGEYRAVIDRRYPLEQVIEATKYVETQQKTGNVVLTVT